MADIVRVSPEETYTGVTAGTTLLVCAYEDEKAFERMKLFGAISLGDLFKKLPDLPRHSEIVFYCA